MTTHAIENRNGPNFVLTEHTLQKARDSASTDPQTFVFFDVHAIDKTKIAERSLAWIEIILNEELGRRVQYKQGPAGNFYTISPTLIQWRCSCEHCERWRRRR